MCMCAIYSVRFSNIKPKNYPEWFEPKHLSMMEATSNVYLTQIPTVWTNDNVRVRACVSRVEVAVRDNFCTMMKATTTNFCQLLGEGRTVKELHIL